jgi:hypothetical protein
MQSVFVENIEQKYNGQGIWLQQLGKQLQNSHSIPRQMRFKPSVYVHLSITNQLLYTARRVSDQKTGFFNTEANRHFHQHDL